MKLWDKGYALDKKIETFTVGKDYVLDQRLVKYDCLASIAHAKMLEKIKILKKEECKKLVSALEEIIGLDSKGMFPISQEDEDCHTAIEKYLTQKLGNAGKKIHTARSRNDQVLVALRLYYKDEIDEISALIDSFMDALTAFKEKYGSTELPGYTHMRKAMPSSVGLWAGAFIESMNDNKVLLHDIEKLLDQSPLGSAAGYGVPMDIDRKLTAKLLGFSRVQENPIYVQNSRGKFESSLLHALNSMMLDLNRMASDLILFSMPEFGYFELSPEICTGSSIMPQKKNPDVLELVRAKYHQAIASEFELKSITSNMISGYNRDVQLTKEATFRGIDVAKDVLAIMVLVLGKLEVNEKKCKCAMSKELYAVKKAYELVEKGMPFRDAYKQVSKEFYVGL